MTSILKADEIQDSSGNLIIKEVGDAIAIGASGDTITIPSGATIVNSGTATNFGGTTAPYVCVGLSSDQGLSDGVIAKVEFDSEIVDSDNKFASYKFTPTVVGKYFVSCNLTFETDVTYRFDGVTCYIYKNGSAVIQTYSRPENNAYEKEGYTQNVSGMVDMDADDYIEIYAKVDTTANTPNLAGGDNVCCVTIFKMTE